MTIEGHSQLKKDFRIPLTHEGLEILCQRLCSEPKIRFCGVINSLGRIVTGGFKDGIQPIDNDSLRKMLYIQSTLELSMKREFDEALGNTNYITTHRDNVAIITIPILQNCLLLLSVERNADIEQIVKKATNLFECNGILKGKTNLNLLKEKSLLFSECV